MKNLKLLLIVVILCKASSLIAQKWISISPTDYFISDVSFVTERQGWFLARDTSVFYQYSLMGTQNGGESWDTVITFPDGARIEMLQMVDSLNGFIRCQNCPGSQPFKHTTDGGFNWVDQGPLALSNSYYFVNADTGFCDMGPDLYKTTDAGLTWSKVSLPADPDPSTPEIESYSLHKIFFADNMHGWICGVHGFTRTYIFYTSDGGNTWLVIDDISGGIYMLNFSDSLHGSFVSATEYHHLAFSTSDNFLNKQLFVYDDYVNAIYTQNDSTSHIAFINQSIILRTTNAGQGFDTIVPEGFKNTPFTIWDFKFFGSTGYAYGSHIFKYIDTLNTAIPSKTELHSLQIFPNPSAGFVNFFITSQKAETVELCIYSQDGRCVWKKSEKILTGENDLRYSFTSLKPGIYLLKIAGKRDVVSQKFILH